MMRKPVPHRARSSIEFRRVRLVVAGDLIADEFIYGRIDRVSREAPVLILSYDSTEIVPGGAGNAANNAAALGARVEVVGVVGRDEAGQSADAGARARRRCEGRRARLAGYVTPVKTRILAGGVHSAKQQVVRIDRAGGALTPSASSGSVEAALVARRPHAPTWSSSPTTAAGSMTPESWQRALAAAKREDAAARARRLALRADRLRRA